ncbi:MAG: hypothetical protein PHU23_09325, partial [Dehalococcoidales bacterium]|nr:hypothetical protein [Dehalococcoidales bacterium]
MIEMDEERLEQKLRDYFNAEIKKVEPSTEWWDNAISRLGEQEQRSDPAKSIFSKLRPSLIAIPLSIFLLVVLVGSLIPMLGGMTPPPPEPPAVVSDGSGGAFIFWDDTPYHYSTGLYANHVDAAGNYLWGVEGKQIATGKVHPPEAISDGSGGGIV